MSEIQIGVSACLLGEQVRYDGGHKRNALLLDEMASHVSFVPVCRELAMFTPLFLVLIAIGGTDIPFALDSIPAVFGVTDEAFIVFAANAFALLGLRALYFLVTGLLDRLGPPARRSRARDRHHHLARRDRRCAAPHHRRKRDQSPPPPDRSRPCRVAARPLRALPRRAARRSRSTSRSSTRPHTQAV